MLSRCEGSIQGAQEKKRRSLDSRNKNKNI